MSLTSSYLVSAKNVKPLLDSLIGAKAPEAFTQKFIENLGFTSTNDRLYISVLKGLGFLDENAVPTQIYFKFLDQSESKVVLAEAIEEAYADLFAVNKEAQNLDVSEVKNKLKTLTQGKYSDKVVSLMAATFKALCEYAEWNNKKFKDGKKIESKKEKSFEDNSPIKELKEIEHHNDDEETPNKVNKSQFHYNIQVHLPDSRDEAVYDAIFKSLRKHLL